MTKQELLDYLGAACDVENAINTCENVITALETSKRHIPHPAAPQSPTRIYTPPKMQTNYSMGFHIFTTILGIIIGLIIGIKLGGWAILIGIVAGYIIGMYGVGFLWDMLDTHQHRKQVRLANVQADRKYEADITAYNREYESYLTSIKIESKAIDEIDQAIIDMRSRIRELDILRQELYSNSTLHPHFQNIMAVNHMREYIDFGICSELEGPNGAYAVYMNDVRTNRICSSIDELRNSVESGFSQIADSHSALMQELRVTQNHIAAMNSSLAMGLDNIQSLIQSNQASISVANDYLNNINQTLKDAAHNEYITMKAAKVEGYLNLHRIS